MARLLVAEDNLVNQRMLVRMLERLGYAADGVNNGVECIERMTERDYDAVLMDCSMPTLDGIEATARIRRGAARESDVVIIAVTASVSQANRERCLDAGMNGFLTKPVDREELCAVLDQLVGGGASLGAAAL